MSLFSEEELIKTTYYDDTDNFNEDKFEDSTENEVCK